MAKPVVLVVEDSASMQDLFEAQLGDRVELLQAYDIESAEELFQKNKERIACIAMDGNVPKADGRPCATFALTGMMRAAGFVGPMVAISGNPEFISILRERGCTHQCEKFELASVLTALLGLAK